MFNSFKATIRKWASLPFEDVTKLLRWSDGKSVDFSNSNLLIASAAKDGQTVAYVAAEPTLIISNYAVAPQTTPSDASQIGDSMDAAFELEAKKIGADRFMIVLPEGVPHERDEVLLRVIFRKIPQNTTIKCNDGSSIEKQMNINPQTRTATWVN
jgi:hypothetical protein